MDRELHRKLGLLEIDPATVPEWRAWGAAIMGAHQQEAIETLREEALTQEHVFLIEVEEKTYLGFFTEGEGLPANLERELNRTHKDLLKRSVIRRIEGVPLYSLRLL